MQNKEISLEEISKEYSTELSYAADLLNENRPKDERGRVIITKDDDLFEDKDEYENIKPLLDDSSET